MQNISAASVKRCLFFLLFFPLIGHAVGPSNAQAQGPKGPSAVAAARLKNKPPKNWIRHYLGDDRYKIAGGIWRVVSTETDRYYYPAWAPEMLRQPAATVIGFPSAEEAEDAGYRPSIYGSGDYLYGLSAAEIAAAKNRGGGKRITLSDGASTVMLPNGWIRTSLGTKDTSGKPSLFDFQGDMLSPRGSENGVFFMFMEVPGTNMEENLTPEKAQEWRTQMNQYASSDAKMAAAVEGAKVGVGKLGGLTGITIIPGKGAKLPKGMAGITTIVARGSKMYWMSAQLAASDRNYGLIVNSFKPG